MLRLSARKVAAIIAVLMLMSCTEQNIYNSCPDHSIRVTGEVLAWYCEVNSIMYSTPEPRYTVWTGETAIVKFVSLAGNTFAIGTDDSSRFDVRIDRGAYSMIVQIGHAYPDTFYNVYLSSDTLLILNTVYDFLDSDTLTFEFRYGSADDSLGIDSERLHMLHIARLTNYNYFDFINTSRSVRIYDGGSPIYVRHRVPLREGKLLWEIYEQAKYAQSLLQLLEGTLVITPGFYTCLEGDVGLSDIGSED